MKIRLHYTDMAVPLSDFGVEKRYQWSLSHIEELDLPYYETMTSNMLLVTRFRVGLKEGDFDELDLVNGSPSCGRLAIVSPKTGKFDWAGWPDLNMDLLLRLS